MVLLIKYTSECSCGGTFYARGLDFNQDPGQHEVEINLDMLGDMALRCDDCGDGVYVPDLNDVMADID